LTWIAQDFQFMSHAIQLARRGRYTCDPNPRVGCVISKNNQLIAEGWHSVTGEAHAEINALNNCDDATGSTVYVTLEPCSHQGRTPPCVEALIKANVKEVIVAMRDPNPAVSGTGIKLLEDSGIIVKQGLLEIEARKLNPGFIKRMTSDMPYVRCKMAMSLDGRTALKNGESQWISSEQSRQDVHHLRAESSAILTSADTVIKDNPLLNARDLESEVKQPIRIITDRQLKTPKDAALFSIQNKTIIYTEKDNQERIAELENVGAEVIILSKSENWLHDVLNHLTKEYEVNDVLVEAGSSLSGALIDAGLADEIIIYMAFILLGDDAQPLMKMKSLKKLSEAKKLELLDVRHVAKDIRLTLAVKG
jgi:diaminohydroxyphosphoribosylaminopyrimidine deaminase / 5-amino-6-(5-phosphoribosylamino)uracil reductase